MYCLKNYESVSESERRFEIEPSKKISYENAGAYLLGRDLRKLVEEKTRDVIKKFTKKIEDKYSPIVQKISSPIHSKNPDIVFDMFENFKYGLLGN